VRFANGAQEVFSEDDELTGGELIPGFRVSVGDIFA
jgi:hypothetical protein